MKKAAFMVAAMLLMFSGKAGAVELCAAIDGSGSLSEAEFALQLEGLASAVEDPTVIPQGGNVVISVVRFEWGATLEIPATVIDSQNMADTVAGWIRSLPHYFGHRTDIVSAIELCMGQFINERDQWIIDISTDGRHSSTLGTDPILGRKGAVAAGLDVLNAIGVGDADMAFLRGLVWPQPFSAPPDPGFTLYVESFSDFAKGMREKVRAEVRLPVPVDIKPASCPNPLNTGSSGVLPVAILGTSGFDVLRIDPETVALEGVAPLSWNYEDVSTPLDSSLPLDSCMSCTTDGPDGYLDMTLKFDQQEVAAALGEVEDGGCYVLGVTAGLLAEFGGEGIAGRDVVRIRMKGER